MGLAQESVRIVGEATKRGLPLRLTGGVAVLLHSHDSSLHERLYGPKPFLKDVDMVTYKSRRSDVHRLFQDLGYEPDRAVMAYFGESRFMYRHPTSGYQVDLFEVMRFSHVLDLKPRGEKGRIEVETPTLTIADLILGKLEIHFVEEKDLKDLTALILNHDIEQVDKPDSVNAQRMASVLSEDWGFWYDAKANFQNMLDHAASLASINKLNKYELQQLEEKVGVLLIAIEKAPKSKEWVARSRIGPKKQWWDDVEELIR